MKCRARCLPLLADARSRGNLYLATELCTRCNYVWLAADDPDGGERAVIESIAAWSQKGFHRQHYSAMLARVQTDLYRGDGRAAWRRLDEQEPMLRRSLLTRVQVLRVESIYLRARSALAIAAAERSGRFLSVASAGARRIAGERMPWSDPIALLLNAGTAYLEGNTPLALRHLHDAAGRFDRADMKLYLGLTNSALARCSRTSGGARFDERPAPGWRRRTSKTPLAWPVSTPPASPTSPRRRRDKSNTAASERHTALGRDMSQSETAPSVGAGL